MNDRNSNWTNSKKPITLSSFQSKVQLIDNWFNFDGDMGFFDGRTFNIKRYLFELSGTGLENTALSELKSVFDNFRNVDGTNMGIKLLVDRSKISFNYKYDSYDFHLVFNIDDSEYNFDRRLSL